MSLYKELKSVEKSIEERVNNQVQTREQLIPSEFIVSVIDENELGAKILGEQLSAIEERYTGNSVLDDAKDGRKSVEETLESLSVKNKGIGKYLPRAKDTDRNKRVEELGDLIGGTRHLKSDSLFAFDNFLVPFLVSAGLSYLAFEGFDYIPGPDLPQFIQMSFSPLIGSFIGYLAMYSRTKPKSIGENAKYVDDIIEKLYHTEQKN